MPQFGLQLSFVLHTPTPTKFIQKPHVSMATREFSGALLLIFFSPPRSLARLPRLCPVIAANITPARYRRAVRVRVCLRALVHLSVFVTARYSRKLHEGLIKVISPCSLTWPLPSCSHPSAAISLQQILMFFSPVSSNDVASV